VVASDRTPRPREILSPAVARNAYASFLVSVTAPAKTMYFVYVQANPENVVSWKLYEVKYSDGIPDQLQELRLPAFGIVPDAASGIPGQTTRLYLLDVWTPAETTPGGLRLEVLVKTDTWWVAPMEMRILGAQALPLTKGVERALPPATEPAFAAARQVLDAYLAGEELPAPAPPGALRAIIRRNALQDVALAQQKHLRPEASQRTGGEWYLRVRDRILKSF
jgi:hypothetical protein